ERMKPPVGLSDDTEEEAQEEEPVVVVSIDGGLRDAARCGVEDAARLQRSRCARDENERRPPGAPIWPCGRIVAVSPKSEGQSLAFRLAQSCDGCGTSALRHVPKPARSDTV